MIGSGVFLATDTLEFTLQRVEDSLTGLFTVGRTEVASPSRSVANRLVANHTLHASNARDLRPKFRHANGLLDTAYELRFSMSKAAWRPNSSELFRPEIALGCVFEHGSAVFLQEQAILLQLLDRLRVFREIALREG